MKKTESINWKAAQAISANTEEARAKISTILRHLAELDAAAETGYVDYAHAGNASHINSELTSITEFITN